MLSFETVSTTCKRSLDAEKQVDHQEKQNRAKASLSKLFTGVKTENIPVIVKRVVEDIDEIVKVIYFADWQNTNYGRK